MLYIGNHLSYKQINDLCICKTAELESKFIELINTKKLNVIIGGIYRHTNVDLDEFNDIYLNPKNMFPENFIEITQVVQKL